MLILLLCRNSSLDYHIINDKMKTVRICLFYYFLKISPNILCLIYFIESGCSFVIFHICYMFFGRSFTFSVLNAFRLLLCSFTLDKMLFFTHDNYFGFSGSISLQWYMFYIVWMVVKNNNKHFGRKKPHRPSVIEND